MPFSPFLCYNTPMKKCLFFIIALFIAAAAFAQNVVEYEFSSGLSMNEFFEKNYRKTWDSLDKYDQYAIAFSCNLFQQNYLFHLDFTARTKLNEYYTEPAALLRDSWGITDYQSLIDMFNSLEEYGHSGAYKKLCGLLDKYPGKSPVEIGAVEHLEILDVTRLFYVRDTRKVAGDHGIEAWDEGREISILRWGIASGYISEQEVRKLIKPVIERIIKNYSSWEQFLDHYLLGRGFYGLTDCTQSEKIGGAVYTAAMSQAYIPLDSIKFTGENADNSVSGIAFEESPDFIKWQEVQKFSNEEIKEENFDRLKEYEKEYSAASDIFFWWHMVMLINYGSNEELINYVEQHSAYLDGFPKDEDVYYKSMYYYLEALNSTWQPVKTLQIIATLPENLQYNIHYYFQYAYANYLMLSICSTQEEFDAYKQRAKSAFKLLKQNNYQLSELLDNWLNSVE